MSIKNELDQYSSYVEQVEQSLSKIEDTLTSGGVEVTTCKITDLNGYYEELINEKAQLQAQITEIETRLEELI